MKYCPNCGTRNESDAAFCKKCGHKLPMKIMKNLESINQQKEINKKNRKRPSRKKRIKAYLALVFMFIIWIIATSILSLLSPDIIMIIGFIGSAAMLLSYKEGYIKPCNVPYKKLLLYLREP